MGHTEWLVLLLTASLFGSSFLFVHIAVETIPPFTTALGRTVLAVPIALLSLKFLGSTLPRSATAWRKLFVLGLLTAAIPYTAIAWGQVHIQSGLAGILFGTIPLFTVVLAPLFIHDEHCSAARLGGATIGLLGVTLIIGPHALGGLQDQVIGAAVTLIAAMSYSLGGIYARRQSQFSAAVMTAGQLISATILLVPIALLVDSPWQLEPSVASVTSVAAAAMLSTAVPAILFFWLVQRAGATNGSLLAFFMPVVAVILGVSVLGDRLSWQSFAGLALILVAAGVVNGRISFRNKFMSSPPSSIAGEQLNSR